MSEGFDYPGLLRAATLAIVREVLGEAADEGLPGDHHFFLTFRTGDEGVELPDSLARRYPEVMTIVVQHQFGELTVTDEGFSVTLRFGGAWERIRVPYSALTAFLDPSVPFGLDFTQFSGGAGSGANESDGAVTEPPPPLASVEPAAPAAPSAGDVLPFRRR